MIYYDNLIDLLWLLSLFSLSVRNIRVSYSLNSYSNLTLLEGVIAMAVNKDKNLKKNKRLETMKKIISGELPSKDVVSTLYDEIKFPPKALYDQWTM